MKNDKKLPLKAKNIFQTLGPNVSRTLPVDTSKKGQPIASDDAINNASIAQKAGQDISSTSIGASNQNIRRMPYTNAIGMLHAIQPITDPAEFAFPSFRIRNQKATIFAKNAGSPTNKKRSGTSPSAFSK